jgi:signal transduction histidine kinase
LKPRWTALSLRWQFVLVLLGAAILPMGVLGAWLARSASRSGEELLRARLETSILQVARDVGERWVEVRSLILDVGEHAVVAELIQAERREATIDLQPVLPEDLERLIGAAAPFLERLSIHDRDGRERARLHPEPQAAGPPDAWVAVEVPVYASVAGASVGTLRARVRWSALARGRSPEAAAANALLAVRSSDDGRVIVPAMLEPERMATARFAVAGEAWVGTSRLVAEPPLELLMAAPLEPFQRPFLQAARTGTLALLAVAAASLLLVTLLTGRMTLSLRRLEQASDAVAGGDLTRRVPEGGGREIAHVAAAFNAMTDRLRATLRRLASRESLAAVGEFAAALAHEVRNPLSSVRIDLQMAREEIGGGEGAAFVERALRSVERLDRTVTGALRIARSGKVDPAPMDLVPVVEGAVHGAEAAFEEQGVRLVRTGTLPARLPWRGDSAALEQVLLNVLLNAAQAARDEAAISLDVKDDGVVITIRDDGLGVPAEDRKRVFEPFYTTREDGTGLGLAMARTITEAHGGEIGFLDAGRGAAVRIRLPRGDGANGWSRKAGSAVDGGTMPAGTDGAEV